MTVVDNRALTDLQFLLVILITKIIAGIQRLADLMGGFPFPPGKSNTCTDARSDSTRQEAGTRSPRKSRTWVRTGQGQCLPAAARGLPLLCPIQASQLEVQTCASCSRRGYFKCPFHLLGKWAIIHSAAACLSPTGHHQVGAISTSLGFPNNYAWFCHIKKSLFAIPRRHACPTQPCTALQHRELENAPHEKRLSSHLSPSLKLLPWLPVKEKYWF